MFTTATTIYLLLVALSFFVLMLLYRARAKRLRRIVNLLDEQNEHLCDVIQAQQAQLSKAKEAQAKAAILKGAKYKEGDTVTIHGHQWTVTKVLRAKDNEAFCKAVTDAMKTIVHNQNNPQDKKPVEKAEPKYFFEYLLNTTIGRSTVRIKLTEADLCEVQEAQTEAIKSKSPY